MKKEISVIILFIVLVSCSEAKNKKEYNATIQEEQNLSLEKIDRKDSVFLNLSPNMTNAEFENAVQNQTVSNVKDKNFQILIEQKVLNFKILKSQNAISLKYYSEGVSKDEKSTTPIEKYYDELISIFRKKYERYELGDFTNKSSFQYFTKEYLKNKKNDSLILQNLIKYDFDKNNYVMFKDSVKTIMIGHSFEHNLFSSLVKKSKRNNLEIYNHTIEIDYFLTKNFDSLKIDILTNYQKHVLGVEKDKLLRKKIKEDNQNQLNKNIDNL
ncbi:hypothetical protein [Cellulophaga baltica]|uniref:Lipoprotein n=1 Tax=Cellulophaga baltica 18 TaxID=1348584 RepID=A0AAU8RGY3_9FLAO|nr:hypothetical protein [Cellulophaga baltica]AIZ42366.1 hypothetical protein M666_12715 [Cellulophaga baltica 18]